MKTIYLLGINWHQIQTIMKRGLARREPDGIAWIGMDEKSFPSGHNYISVINDLDGSRVLEVAEGGKGNAASVLITHALDARQMPWTRRGASSTPSFKSRATSH